MNHIYKNIWNEALGVWMAVSELAKGHGKRSTKSRQLLMTGLLVCSSSVWALPTGNELVAGQATVSTPNVNTMQINQASQNAVINWQGFSVGQNQAVNIQQPNTQAALLNRVVGQDASQIQGQINANGQVYLVNPNGVLFSKTAQVDVGGLVATTHDISNQDFMNGKAHFTQNGGAGTVENHGTINTKDGGVVALIGTSVTNTGTINTPKGTTALAAGKTVDLDFQGNGLVEVKVSEATLNAHIKNQGAIVADGGRVVMTAKAAGQLIDTVINQEGIVRAQSLVERNGEIILDGGDNGAVKISGTLDARNTNLGLNSTGGNITVTGKEVQLNNGALITASGNAGGGNIQLGDQQNTQQTTISEDATVTTQATQQGKAGNIAVLANMNNGTVHVAGKLNAAAPVKGNGGHIDTSAAKVKIVDSATISTKANNGNNGKWLIDPNDFIISATGDITANALNNALNNNDVSIQTGATTASCIGAICTTGSSGNGDIFVNQAVTWTANTLTLSAFRNININANLNGTGGKLALEVGQGAIAANNSSDYSLNNSANITLGAGQNFSTKLGSDGVVKNYTVITSLGAENSTTGTDLQGMNGDLVMNYALGTNIDASPTSGWTGGFRPVGTYPPNTWMWTTPITAFTGNFAGLGHTVTGLTINRPTTDYVGLFGVVFPSDFWSNTSIRDIGMIGGTITGQNYVGGLVGFSGGGISNSYATGNVTGMADNVGGLAGGSSNNNISNSYATGNVSGTENVGGLVGDNSDGNINNSYATGNISGSDRVGGLVGYSSSSISNSYATGNVSGSDSVGGLVGYGWSSISNSYATGNVSGTTNVGGLVGAGSSISNSYYNIDQVLINGEHRVTIGGLYNGQYQDWFNHNKTLNIANYASISGLDSNGYYGINSVQGLKDILGFVEDNSAGYKFKLNNNLDLAGNAGFFIPYFSGEFDGANHTITNLAVNAPFISDLGMFGSNKGSISNLGVTNVSLIGGERVGGLVGNNTGNINNSYATDRVSGTAAVGGLVGYNTGNINNSYATANVRGTDSVGGLVGSNWLSNISNSYATGNVSGTDNIGGLIGSSWTYIEAFGFSYHGLISNSYATGNVSGVSNVGGLIGNSQDIIRNSYATGNVIGTDYVGGLIGIGSSIIGESYAKGNISGTNYVGGLVGLFNATDGWNITSIGDSYATGNVSGTTNVGGLVGAGSNISNSYYNIDQVLINGEHRVTTGGLYNGQYQDWFSHNKTLDIANYASISGLDSNGYYGINSVQSLKDMLGFVEDNSASYKFKLNNNLDLAGNAGFFIPYFAGEFDGANHTIANLTVNAPFISNLGMFGNKRAGGTINNLGVTNVSLVGDKGVGGLAGASGGNINNSYATGSVSGTDWVGGLVGNGGNISNSYAAVNVRGINYVGGLMGDGGDISNSYATGNVSGINYYVGGLIGLNYGNISNSFWNTNTAGQANAIGVNDYGTATNVVGKATAELQQMATFSDLGWDITNTGGSNAVWRIYEGQSTPLLRSFLTPLTVTASNQTSTYDGLAYTGGLIASYSVAGADTSGHLFNINTAYNNAINAGVYNTVPNLYSDQQGYDITQINGNLTINPATLIYTADTANRVYGAANPDFTGMVTGFVNGETLATATTGILGFSSLAHNNSAVGSYAILGSGLRANYGNYNFVQAAANNVALTINPAPVPPVVTLPDTAPSNVATDTPPISTPTPAPSNVATDTSPISTPTPAPQALVLSDNRFNVDLQSQRVPLQTSTTLTGQNREIEKTDVSHTESNISIEAGGIRLP